MGDYRLQTTSRSDYKRMTAIISGLVQGRRQKGTLDFGTIKQLFLTKKTLASGKPKIPKASLVIFYALMRDNEKEQKS